jgi:hypothetical protein
MARGAGLNSPKLVRCHYTADGICDGLAGDADYADAGVRKRMSRMEKIARELPIVKHFARASLVVGIVE